MQSQDASAEFLIKFWPWLEANRKRLIGVAVVVGVALLVWYFITTQRAQKAVEAGQAYTALQLNLPPNPTMPQVTAAFLNIASQYPGTLAAQRAQLQAAVLMFGAGNYADAQALLQKVLDANSAGPLTAAAELAIAACLEAQNKPDDAIKAYRAVTTSHADSAEALPARFALGRVLEAQGKLAEAGSYFQAVMSSPLAGSLGSEAAQRLAQIQAKLAAVKPAATNSVPSLK